MLGAVVTVVAADSGSDEGRAFISVSPVLYIPSVSYIWPPGKRGPVRHRAGQSVSRSVGPSAVTSRAASV